MNKVSKYAIKIVGWLIIIGATLAFLYHLWIFLDSTIHTIRIGSNSGTGLGQVFGIVGIFIFGGLIALGYAIIRRKI